MSDVSDKTVMVVDNGLFCEMAVRLARDFGKVYYFCPWVDAFPRMNKAMIGHGLEGIEVVDDIFGPHFDDISVFAFPDVYFGELQVWLESEGRLVWGARMGEEMELERDSMKELMKDIGLPVGPWSKVKGMDALREYLKANPKQYVKVNKWRGLMETFYAKDYKSVEPKLDEVEYNLGEFKKIIDFIVEKDLTDKVEIGVDGYTVDGKFPSKLLAGIEVKDRGYIGVFKDYSDLPKEMTDFDKAISPTLKNYGYRGFYSTEIRVGKDHVPYMIDMCFDDETEVLSERGWIPFSACTLEDRLATLNASNRAIEYQHPERLIAHDYSGEMVRITNRKRTIDCLVTPEHAVLRTDRDNKTIFKERADSLTDKGFIPRTGKWNPTVPIISFVLPEYHNEWEFIGQYGHHVCTREKHEDAVEIPMTTWAEFLAWYLSEGSTSGAPKGRAGMRYVTQISQTKYPSIVRAILEKLPFKFSYDGKMFRISSAQLATHLHQFGLCAQKSVPDYIKQSSTEVIRVFLDNYCLGDGSSRRNEKTYTTTSKKMADDLQELIFKCGSVANIRRCPNKGTSMACRGKTYLRNHDQFVVQERIASHDFWFETHSRKADYITSCDYSGMVYCATVPNGTLYVRRHGKPFWSGNCARAGSPPSELFSEFYLNLSEIIWDGANGTVTDPKPAGKYGAELLIHSTWADKNWQPVDFPEEVRSNVKLRNAIKIDGRYYVVPQSVGLPEIGAVIGWGSSKKAAMEMALEIADQVSGYYIDVPKQAFEESEEEIEKLDSYGIKLF